MSHRYLGDAFDIHGGGSDLIFPHHENEIAQSEGAFGAFARYWMHSGMLNFGGEKMSKSLGNVVTIRRAAETHDLESLRLLLISVHYRSPAAFSIARDDAGQPVYPDLDEAEAAARLLLSYPGTAGCIRRHFGGPAHAAPVGSGHAFC